MLRFRFNDQKKFEISDENGIIYYETSLDPEGVFFVFHKPTTLVVDPESLKIQWHEIVER